MESRILIFIIRNLKFWKLYREEKITKSELRYQRLKSVFDELSYKDLLTNLENESIAKGKDEWNFKYRAAISRPQEWFNRSWDRTSGI